VSWFPFAPASDNRIKQHATPILTRNCALEPNPLGADGKRPYILGPTPGKKYRLRFDADPVQTLGGASLTTLAGIPLETLQGAGVDRNVRCLFARPGVRDGTLFAVAGDKLFSVSSSWAATQIGTIDGTEPALMDGFQTNLLIKGDAALYEYGEFVTLTTLAGDLMTTLAGETISLLSSDSASLQTIIDIDTPPSPYTMAVLALRLVTSPRNSNVFDWSMVDNAESFPAAAFASVQFQNIENITESGGYLWIVGANRMQPWRAVGGDDADAFDTAAANPLEVGLVTRDALAKIDQTIQWIGRDNHGGRGVFRLDGFSPVRIEHRELEIALQDLSEDDLPGVRCFSYADGAKVYFAAALPNGATYFHDLAFDKWHERSCGVNLHASAYGKHVVASVDGPELWTWERDQYFDDGADGPDYTQRVMRVHVPLATTMPVDEISIDGILYDQPLSGQGAAPEIMVRFSRDGGQTWSDSRLGIIRRIGGPRNGTYAAALKLTRLGRFSAQHGMMLDITISDPVGFAAYGVWVNENPN